MTTARRPWFVDEIIHEMWVASEHLTATGTQCSATVSHEFGSWHVVFTRGGSDENVTVVCSGERGMSMVQSHDSVRFPSGSRDVLDACREAVKGLCDKQPVVLPERRRCPVSDYAAAVLAVLAEHGLKVLGRFRAR